MNYQIVNVTNSKKWLRNDVHDLLNNVNLKDLTREKFVKEYCNLPLLDEDDKIFIHKIKIYGFEHDITTPTVLYGDFTNYDNIEFPNTNDKKYEYEQNEYVTPVVIYYTDWEINDIKNIRKARVPSLYWHIFACIKTAIIKRKLDQQKPVFPAYIEFSNYNCLLTKLVNYIGNKYFNTSSVQKTLFNENGNDVDSKGNEYPTIGTGNGDN